MGLLKSPGYTFPTLQDIVFLMFRDSSFVHARKVSLISIEWEEAGNIKKTKKTTTIKNMVVSIEYG